jgi:hypothetical protein
MPDEPPQIGGDPPAEPAEDAPAADDPAAGDVIPVVAVVAQGGGGGPAPPASPPGAGPGGSSVSAKGIVVMVALFFGLSVLCVYSMLTFWPTQAGLTADAPPAATTTESGGGSEEQPAAPPDEEQAAPAPDDQAQPPQPVEPPPKRAGFLWLGPWNVDIEILFFLIVACAGALGGSVAAIRSLGVYVGSRTLFRSWIPFYFFKPLVGALLATIMYLLLRAGLFSPSASNAQVSPYGFAAIGALVGLFSDQASEKLKRVAEELFTRPYTEPPPDHYAAPAQDAERT